MSELQVSLARTEKVSTEQRLDDADKDFLDRFLVAHVSQEKAERQALRDQLARCLAELDQARGKIADLTISNSRMAREFEELKAERDDYLKSLYAMMRPTSLITEAEIEEHRKNGVIVDDVIAELEGQQVDEPITMG